MIDSFTRRDILQTGLSAAAAMALPAFAADKPASLGIVDTHTHFYDPTRPQGVPWPAKTDAVLYRPVLPAEYRQMTEPLGVVGTIVVEASAWVEDNQWVLDLAEKEPFLLGLVGNLPPGSEAFREHFPRLVKQPRFRGIRVNAGPLGQNIDNPAFLADLKKLAETDRELDVNGRPDLLPLATKLAEKLPDLRIVINHLANVRIDGDKLDADWLKGIDAAAKHSRVFMKVSALVEGAAQGGRTAPTDPAYYRPVLDAMWRAFGDDRVIYGSNWPVSARAASYQVVQTIVQEYVKDRGPEATEKFFRGNAQKAYQWPARG
jgi:predicted TIM-barrel fold metal-dependent hydrolase